MTDGSAIQGASLRRLSVIDHPRGGLMHMLRADSPEFQRFGEIYFSEILSGEMKGWKRHSRSTQHIAVPVGRTRFILFDDRAGSPSQGRIERHDLGRPDAYHLLVIPPGVWYGWKSVGTGAALVANCVDVPHEPGEGESAATLAPLDGVVW